MMIDQFRLTDPLGVVVEASINDPRATSILSTLGLYGGLGVRVDKQDRLTDGTVPARVARTGRAWTPGGRIIGLSDQGVVEWALRIGGLFGGSDNDSTGLLEITQGDLQLHAEVQLDGEPKIYAARDLGYVVWEMPLYSPDPHLYGSARTMQLRPVDTGAGFVWPGFADGFADWGVSGGDEAQLTNAGNAAALPTVTVTVDDGSGFRLSSGARSVEWVGACSRSVPVVVDMAGRVLVGGVDRSAQLVRREWLSVPPRGVVSMSLSTLSGGGGSAIATVQDTWI